MKSKNKKIFEIAGLETSEIKKLEICWQEAQKELKIKNKYSDDYVFVVTVIFFLIGFIIRDLL